ncbi:MAG: nitrate reductase associated protein [Leptolyngbyaceae cyanobacterium T60_A2020_046]|nr:nitrate reductase associated protein [Leptolyngbyaceae cyanobacterium T60_A2020_046]
MTHPSFFDFEAEFTDALRCIPMLVRFKLDTCGVKLKLEHWHRFTQAERQELVDRSCDTPEAAEAYRDRLQTLVAHYMGTPAKTLPINPDPPWGCNSLPEQVLQEAARHHHTLTADQWQQLAPLQKFALIKLSRPGHENRNFLPALREFGLIPLSKEEDAV